jgi:hypothetical protein
MYNYFRISTFLLSVFAFVCLLLLPNQVIQAATSTVCASGCDYTTLGGPTGAFMNVIFPGDVIAINASYSSTTEPSFPIQMFTPNITLDCQANPTLLGSTSTNYGDPSSNILYLASTTTIRNCSFGNITIGTPSYISGFTLENNTFSPSIATSSIALNNGAALFTIENNTNIGSFSFGGGASPSSTGGVIRNNTFYSKARALQPSVFQLNANSLNMTVTGNSFSFYSPSESADGSIVLSGDGIVFATNTIRFLEPQDAAVTQAIKAKIANSGSLYIGGNFIHSPATSTCGGLIVYPDEVSTPAGTVHIVNNTLRLNASCQRSSLNGGSYGINISDNMGAGSAITANIYYNIISNGGSTAGSGSLTGLVAGVTGAGSALTLNEQYNGFSGFYSNIEDGIGGAIPLGTGSRTNDPIFRTGNVSEADDFDIAPFSNYLDVTGVRDIGATDAIRRSTITIDDNGTIDYSSVDATSTSAINSFIRSGDAVTIAAGSYSGISVSSTYATTGVTITGAGNSTIITASEGEDASKFTNISTSTLSNVRVTGASVGTASYSVSKMLFSHSGNDYNDGIPGFGVPSESMLIWTASGCELSPVTADGTDITALTAGGTASFSVALIQLGGAYLTAFVPTADIPNGAALDADCGGIGLTSDVFITNVFTPTGGVYTYNSAAVISAGATLLGGLTTPPAITRTLPAYAGIRMTNASGWTISGVTSTANVYGIVFDGTTANVTLQDSVIENSTSYDVYAEGNYRNIIDNVSFTRASTTMVSPLAELLVKFRVRAYVTDRDGGAAITGISASSTDNASTETSLGTTTSGYTSYARLPAYLIDILGSAITNGGYNPYTMSIGSLSGYSASTSDAFNLTTPNQTVSLVAHRTAPTAPSGHAISSVAANTASASWTDNATNEYEYLFDIANQSIGESFPTDHATTLSADATSQSITGLLPNVEYRARVAARTFGGTSAYATSSSFYTLAATSSAPTLTALSGTSLSLSIPADGNSTSTQYAIYSSTLGGYMSALGVVGAIPTWQTTSTWSTLTVSSLTCATSYAFVTIARNLDLINAATSTAATVTTSACASSSSSGGGGGSGGAAGGAIQTIFSPPVTQPLQPVPIITTPVDPTPVLPTPPPSSQGGTDSALSTFTVEQFLASGRGTASRSLGRGEREAVLRDAIETMGRTAAQIPVDDLERISNGEIPRTRSLAYERSMVPRALATFRTIFGHAPNFQNADENLAWNTLMYRIRFPRDLSAERRGISDFRSLFRGVPQSPFQWSVVRVLGYVR